MTQNTYLWKQSYDMAEHIWAYPPNQAPDITEKYVDIAHLAQAIQDYVLDHLSEISR